MPRSPLALAALATVAVPGLDAFDVRRPVHPGTDFDIAVVVDANRRRWVVRAPVHAAAGAALEAEAVLLDGLARASEAGTLPFAVPRPVGFAHLPEGGRAAVHAEIPGVALDVTRLVPGPGMCAAVGRAVAAIHELPVSVVEDAGLPAYDAQEYRARRQSEVDEAARTGKVPPTLLRRWEERLEDVALWRFQPTVVHGDLTNERILVRDDEVTGILHWGDASVADPADDLSWLLVAAPPEVADSIMEAYQLRRTELLDPYLTERALLAGELALARWLLYGVRSGDADVVADAVEMLEDLDAHTRPVPVGPAAATEPVPAVGSLV
ncbi:phosphotransferase [Cellulomonas composti]|uniref:Aminoglycoside phosphotransferase n=1 Tax=Cellulomonas composti TaxID=266130 RepID=A0A511JA01_9CELL|nr:phosphotransferase [Cellulomonas composti]GEL94589.1 aminoglycoside phosphotransferase [Cellulomonas composti]